MPPLFFSNNAGNPTSFWAARLDLIWGRVTNQQWSRSSREGKSGVGSEARNPGRQLQTLCSYRASMLTALFPGQDHVQEDGDKRGYSLELIKVVTSAP